MNKASVGDGIPVELFQILKDDAVKVMHSICQHLTVYFILYHFLCPEVDLSLNYKFFSIVGQNWNLLNIVVLKP